MRVINLTTCADFSGYRRQIRRHLLPVVNELPEVGEFVQLRTDKGIVRSFERLAWNDDGSEELYQIMLYDEVGDTEFASYCVIYGDMDDILNDEMMAERRR